MECSVITLQELKRAREYLPLIGRCYRSLRESRREIQELALELARCQSHISLILTERDDALTRHAELSTRFDVLRAERDAALEECEKYGSRLSEMAAQRDAALETIKEQSERRSFPNSKAEKLCQPKFVDPPSEDSQSPLVRDRFAEFLRLIQPRDAVQQTKLRIGGPNDGGYIMIDAFPFPTIAVSIGIGSDVSWDLDVANRGIDVYQFDHSLELPPISHPRFLFSRSRVVADEAEYADGISLEHILSPLPEDADIILKMDIEGDEWDVLASVPGHCLRNVSQMVIEFHSLHRFASARWAERACEVITKLVQSHKPVHLHGNNYAGFAVLGGIPFPDVFELTLLRNDNYDFAAGAQKWPTELDRPNNPARADLAISFR